MYTLSSPHTCHMTRPSRPPEATHYVIVSSPLLLSPPAPNVSPSTTFCNTLGLCSSLSKTDSPSFPYPQSIIEWKTRVFLCATWQQMRGMEAVLHSCQLRRYMQVSCQFHRPADLPSGHSLTMRLRAPGSRPAHSGEHSANRKAVRR